VTETDYHLFVHILSAGGDLLTQYDAEPREGRYPTSGWSSGEVVEECITLDGAGLSEPPQRVSIGLYRWPDGERLPAADAQGTRLENDSLYIEIHAP
jgi:hypothetical protein